MSGLYTNTSNVKAVIGLVVTTILVGYAANNSTKIVNDTISLAKRGIEKVTGILHKEKRQYKVYGSDFDGKLYDTGRRIWK